MTKSFSNNTIIKEISEELEQLKIRINQDFKNARFYNDERIKQNCKNHLEKLDNLMEKISCKQH